MERGDYFLYCQADRWFFETPGNISDEADRYSSPAPPEGWTSTVSGLWRVHQPPRPVLPPQGWKVHVSATPATAGTAIERVARWCFGTGVPFKHLRGEQALRLCGSKQAHRATGGKLITLYPADEAGLVAVLHGLGPLLDGLDGPYILGDLRIGAGPLHVRYGGFARFHTTGEDDEPVLAIRDPAGRLVPDVRGPVFRPPPWVPLPPVLAEAAEPPAADDRAKIPYRITQAVRFTAAGGVYLAQDPATGAEVVLKEARPHAGLDGAGKDAVHRLHTEFHALRLLAGVSEVPRALSTFTVWEHQFLAIERIPGKVLMRLFLERNPLPNRTISESARTEYLAWATGVVDRLGAALAKVHDLGLAWGDVHPANVLVRPDDSVALIDFEVATPLAEHTALRLGASGFIAPAGTTGRAREEFALDRIALAALLPYAPNLIDLAPAKAPALVADALRDLAPEGLLAERAARCAGTGAVDRGTELFAAGPDWPRLRGELVDGVLSTATPDRADRLFPGDARQFRGHGGVALAYGAAGVLHALHHAGAVVPTRLVDWLAAAGAREEGLPPGGLYTGLPGVAWVLAELGRPEAARALLARSAADLPAAPGLARGRAGIALNLLAFAERTGEQRYLDQAWRLTDELAATTAAGGFDGLDRLGLFDGPAGIALLFLRRYERDGGAHLLAHAERLLRAELAGCVWDDQGACYADRDDKRVAHLFAGTAGIALVLTEFLRHHEADGFRDAVAAMVLGMQPRACVNGGLFEGRAGLMAALRVCDPGNTAAISEHVRRLGQHALHHEEHGLLFAGQLAMRASVDLATGSAGVLTALRVALTGSGEVLPQLGCQPRIPIG
ncbi:hypothetical protein JOF53_000537 [Crossiella equi]|uniref:Protein kinase domain-containing protein n=1 Tax=Crossiella equi TaxID=130796 RepID=A0ABS5A503_9PSEU|nr:class III lanthionine synthetase LanKC [Crossiella equi]MBP2471665.1 hypothetical protein [Crossiella equi]